MSKITPLEKIVSSHGNKREKHHLNENFICHICFEKIDKPIHATCQHKFCEACYTEYLETLIQSSKFEDLKCPQEYCYRRLNDSFLKQLLSSSSFEKYQKYVHIDLPSRKLSEKYCPTPGCLRELPSKVTGKFIVCDCKSKICTDCYGLWHEPKTCLESLDLTYKLYAENNEVKYCYMCKSQVTRIQGCSHMKCFVCDYEWCWDCGQEFVGAHFANCSRFWNPKPPKVLQNQVYYEKAQKDFKKAYGKLSAPIRMPLNFLCLIILILLELIIKIWQLICYLFPSCKKNFEIKVIKKTCISVFLDIILSPFEFLLGILYFFRAIIYFLIGIFNRIELLLLKLSKTKRWIERNSTKFGYMSSIRMQQRYY